MIYMYILHLHIIWDVIKRALHICTKPFRGRYRDVQGRLCMILENNRFQTFINSECYNIHTREY